MIKRIHTNGKTMRAGSNKPGPMLESAEIDARYGLEPVFEPDAAQPGSDALTQFVMLGCPYCGEQFETRIDLTNGSTTYVEDCQVCCQPIDVTIELTEAGGLKSVRSARLD